ncbi:MAG: STAS-like domain-containing protein [Thermoleophilia bacterium]
MTNSKRKKTGTPTRSSKVDNFLLKSLAAGHKRDLVTYVAGKLGLTRQAVYLHVRKLIEKKQIVASGKTRSRIYELHESVYEEIVRITPYLEEHIVWEKQVQPHLPELPRNILDICFHGFTEIFNNVKDHSEGTVCRISIARTPLSLTMGVDDDGIGIFNKLRQKFGLDDEHHAALELAKGKLTTDEQRHSGEGIFFTSRMFDIFAIFSRGFIFLHEKNDWIAKAEDLQNTIGTSVRMSIDFDSRRTAQSIFDEFATGEDYGFVRTMVPVKLAKYGDVNLVSRSQAKRVLARLDRFQIVLLDFRDVDTIGQAFADEVFRVFRLMHPEIRFEVTNANKRVSKVIDHVRSAG